MKALFDCFWQVSLKRALIESGLMCLVLLMVFSSAVSQAGSLPITIFFIMLFLVCSAMAALRLKFNSTTSPVTLLSEGIYSILLFIMLTSITAGFIFASGNNNWIETCYGEHMGMCIIALLIVPEYLVIRVLSWAWLRWRQLCSRHYALAITDAMVQIIAVFLAIVLLPVTFYFAAFQEQSVMGFRSESAFTWAVLWVFIYLSLYLTVLLTGLFFLFPPILLVSYLVARGMTKRIKNLNIATQAMQKGDLHTRVKVEGEDEIAQLQNYYNNMAARTEKFTLDLQLEKDKVDGILAAHRQMVADISHELRNPAAIIAGYSSSLCSGWKERKPEDIENDLQIISHEAQRLQTILNDLLELARLETGKLNLNMQPVEAVNLISNVKDTFSSTAWMGKRVQISMEKPEKDIWVYADTVRLEQVMVNLVQNAVQHTSPGGLVAIDIHENKDSVCIEVEDTGEGIPDEDVPHIWERFYRCKEDDQQLFHGAGLGLALVKELTEAMKGSVSFVSQTGCGSIFRVNLSKAPQQQDSQKREQSDLL